MLEKVTEAEVKLALAQFGAGQYPVGTSVEVRMEVAINAVLTRRRMEEGKRQFLHSMMAEDEIKDMLKHMVTAMANHMFGKLRDDAQAELSKAYVNTALRHSKVELSSRAEFDIASVAILRVQVQPCQFQCSRSFLRW
jgi:BMFP domain-containing protein YqiC